MNKVIIWDGLKYWVKLNNEINITTVLVFFSAFILCALLFICASFSKLYRIIYSIHLGPFILETYK